MMARKIPHRTEAELQLVKQFILLPIILDTLERDIKVMETVPLKMLNIYYQLLRGVQDLVTADLAKVRKSLRDHGLKVYEQRRTNMGVEAAYLCRGYHHHFSMLWGVVRGEVETRLRAYLRIKIKDVGNEGRGTGVKD